MADNWYPVIDDEKCVQCLECVEFCPHGVFEEQDGAPVVVAPEECVEFCRACQKLCDAEAITYAGATAEQAGARVRTAESETSGASKKLRLTVYGPGCPKCNAAEEVLNEAARQAGADVDIEKVTDLAEMAKAGVRLTPALAVDDEVVIEGTVPELAQAVSMITSALAQNQSAS